MNTVQQHIINGLKPLPTYKKFGGYKVYRYRLRRKSSEWIGKPSPKRSTLTTRTLHGHCRIGRQQSAKYYKSGQDFTTHSNCICQCYSWESSFSMICGYGDARGTSYYLRHSRQVVIIDVSVTSLV